MFMIKLRLTTAKDRPRQSRSVTFTRRIHPLVSVCLSMLIIVFVAPSLVSVVNHSLRQISDTNSHATCNKSSLILKSHLYIQRYSFSGKFPHADIVRKRFLMTRMAAGSRRDLSQTHGIFGSRGKLDG